MQKLLKVVVIFLLISLISINYCTVIAAADNCVAIKNVAADEKKDFETAVDKAGVIHVSTYLSVRAQSSVVYDDWKTPLNGRTAYNAIRESMVQDIRLFFDAVNEQAIQKGGKADILTYYKLWDNLTKPMNLYAGYKNTATGKDAEWVPKSIAIDGYSYPIDSSGHYVPMLQWGYIMNLLLSGDLDFVGSIVNKGNEADEKEKAILGYGCNYINFALDGTMYSLNVSKDPKMKVNIDGYDLDINQVLRLAWYEAFAKYTFAIYTFKASDTAFTTLTDMQSHLENLNEHDVVLDSFVHPILGVVPCIYDKESDLAQWAHNRKEYSTCFGADGNFYIKSMAQLVSIFFSPEAQYHIKHINFSTNPDGVDAVCGSIQYSYAMLHLCNDLNEVYSGNIVSIGEHHQVTNSIISECDWFYKYATLMIYPFLYYPSNESKSCKTANILNTPIMYDTILGYEKEKGTTKVVDGSLAYKVFSVLDVSVFINPAYITMWAYSCRFDFNERLGLIGTQIAPGNNGLCLIDPYSYEINGTATEVQPKVLFNAMLPITYIDEWNDTNLYGIYSYTDTLLTKEEEKGDTTIKYVTDASTSDLLIDSLRILGYENMDDIYAYSGAINWLFERTVDGLTDLSSFTINKGQRYLGSNDAETALQAAYDETYSNYWRTLETYDDGTGWVEGSLSAMEKDFNILALKLNFIKQIWQKKAKHLNYAYGSDSGQVYISEKTGAIAQPNSDGTELVAYDADGNITNFVTIASKFDVPYFYCIANGKVYAGKASKLQYYFHQGPLENQLVALGNNEPLDYIMSYSNISYYSMGIINYYEEALDGLYVTPQSFSVRLETAVLPTNTVNIGKSDSADSKIDITKANDSIFNLLSYIVQSHQKHLILIPNTVNECIADTWQFKNITSEADGTTETINVLFYVETGRSLKYNYTDIESLDLVTPNQNVRYTTTNMGDAQGSFYSMDGRLSLSTPMPLKQNMVFLPHGVAMQISPDYIEDSGLLTWLQTRDAANFVNANTEMTGYTVTTLYQRLISQGVHFGNNSTNPLSYDDITRFEEISNELSVANSLKSYSFVFTILNVVGLCVVAYGVLLVVAYFIDMLDTFTNISILNLITFGGLRAVHTAQELTDMGITGAERKKYVTRNGILLRWAVCTIIGIMLATSNQLIIWAITLFNIVMSWF